MMIYLLYPQRVLLLYPPLCLSFQGITPEALCMGPASNCPEYVCLYQQRNKAGLVASDS